MSAFKAVLMLNKVVLHISNHTLNSEIPHLCSASSVLVSNDRLVGITKPQELKAGDQKRVSMYISEFLCDAGGRTAVLTTASSSLWRGANLEDS